MNHTLLVRQCLEWLAMNRIPAIETKTGTAWVEDRPISYGHVGMADIHAIPRGLLVAIEAKVGKDKQRPKQKTYERIIRRHGAVYLIVQDTVDHLAEQMQTLVFPETRLCGERVFVPASPASAT